MGKSKRTKKKDVVSSKDKGSRRGLIAAVGAGALAATAVVGAWFAKRRK